MKKHLKLLVLIIITGHALAQWSNPITICDGYVPDMDINQQNGHLHIVSILNGVIYTETDALGNIVSSPAVIPGTTSDTEFWNFGATVAVDMDGYPHVCFRVPKGDNNYDIKYTRKTASGWRATPILITSNKKRGYVVRMDIDTQNRVHIGVGYDDKPDDGLTTGPIAYFRVFNNTIQKSVLDLNPSNIYSRVDNRCEMTIGYDNTIHILAGCPGYPNTLEGPITYFRSTNGGETIETIGDIHNIMCPTRNGVPDIAADELGIVHMLYGAKQDADRNYEPSLRYVRFRNDTRLVDQPITAIGEVTYWDWNPSLGQVHGKNYGLGSIAVSNDGSLVMVAYLNRPSFWSSGTFYQGNLYVTQSADSGVTWSSRVLLAQNVCNAEGDVQGRNLHLLRSYKNNFYVIYPSNVVPKKIKLRYIRNVGDNPPTANAGGPYSVNEGTAFTLNGSGSVDTGLNRGITKYEWDLNNDGVYEFNVTQPTYQTTVTNDLNSTVRLRVTDNSGQTAQATTTLQVKNVTPTIEIGSDMTINEGSPVSFTCTLTDPGTQDTHAFAWNFRDGTTSSERNPSHIFANDGQFRVRLTVTDSNSGTAKDSLMVTVNNVTPVADAGGPYRYPINAAVQLLGSAADPSSVDMQNMIYSWDLNNDAYYETSGQNVTHVFTEKKTYIIGLKVQDNKTSNTDTAKVIITNDPPVISGIQGQTIPEGGTFSPVYLDNYVYDPDQTVDNLTWTVRGQTQLITSITDRVFMVTTPNVDWNGSETLTLKAADPGGMADSVAVVYSVTSMNDPPEWTRSVPNYPINEDAILFVSLDSLWRWAADVDHADPLLTFTLSAPSTITWQLEPDNRRIRIKPQANWNGTAMISWTVTDPGGLSDVVQSTLTVQAVIDPPVGFSLIEPMLLDSSDHNWPDIIPFRWHASYDPDNPYGLIYYILTLRHLDGFEQRSMTVFDTTYNYQTDKTLPDGRYLWSVTAYVASGLSIQSTNSGFIIVGILDGVYSTGMIPETFTLNQNVPNPFNPETRFSYQIPEPSEVRIGIYNTMGQEIRILVDQTQTPGMYFVTWDGTDGVGVKAPSGLYICRMFAGNRVFYKKLMLIQ